jgi:DMSO reductase family type II enzyme heme b subunit
MKAQRVDASATDLLDPVSDAWGRTPHETFPLTPTPLVMQPSGYIQKKWETSPHGAIPEVHVAAVHNGKELYFRLEWRDPTDDGKPDDMADFPDQAAVMMPIKDDAPIMEMGTPAQPVNMWLWRGDLDTPHYVTATGRGTTVRQKESPLVGRAAWRAGGLWQVVIGRPFNVSLPAGIVVPLAPGLTHKCTFAVWQGSEKERGGLKAYEPRWQPLEIAP